MPAIALMSSLSSGIPSRLLKRQKHITSLELPRNHSNSDFLKFLANFLHKAAIESDEFKGERAFGLTETKR
jgi:hypothetical protein